MDRLGGASTPRFDLGTSLVFTPRCNLIYRYQAIVVPRCSQPAPRYDQYIIDSRYVGTDLHLDLTSQ
jgi:hypothetical protein